MIEPDWQSDDGHIQLYCGDCREILPNISADAIVTDPPWGVDLGNHAGASAKGGNHSLRKAGYRTYDDRPENFSKIIVPAIKAALSIAKRGLIFCTMPQGYKLPIPAAVGGVFVPAGSGRTTWGFNCLSHCLFYGKPPALRRGSYPIAIRRTDSAIPNGHPCPKPISWMLWAVEMGADCGEIVLDPFMGSGTTGVACVQLNRRFVGIEIDREYFEIAQKRIVAALLAYNGGPLYVEQKPRQGELFAGQAAK